MNKKLIAAAVSAAVIPAVGVADSSFYGRVNNAYDVNSLGAESKTDHSTIGSRFGFRGNNDIGNGLTAHGHIEFGIVTDKEGNNQDVRDGSDNKTGNSVDISGIDTRVGKVGLSGPFGRIDLGNQTSAYSATFGTLVSPTYSLGYYLYSSVGGGIFRSSNAAKYSNTFGALTAQLEMRFNGSEEGGRGAEKSRGDGYGLGLSFALSDNLTLAAAINNESAPDSTPDAPDNTLTGVGLKANFGGFQGIVGWQSWDRGDDVTAMAAEDGMNNANVVEGKNGKVTSIFLNLSGAVSDKTSWLLAYSSADDGTEASTNTAMGTGNTAVAAVDDSTQLTWGIYHNMGSGMRIYYEGTSVASPKSGNDGARHLLGMRVDF